MENKFKIGDLFLTDYGFIQIVSITEKNIPDEKMVHYHYIDGSGGGCKYYSRFLDGFKQACKNTRLARKLYPNAEISEDEEWIYV